MSTTVRALSLPSGFVSKPANDNSVKSGFVPTTDNCARCKTATSMAFMKRHPRVGAKVCSPCFGRLDAEVAALKPRKFVRGIKSSSKGPNQSAAARAARRAVRTECPMGPTISAPKYGAGKIGPQKAGMMNKGRAKK